MKVSIEDGCIACGACESFCSDVFKVSDTCTVDESKVAGNEDCVKEAADACPVSVISVVE
ncbi:ferredoxin [bacterium]|nr:ferredoxin [bacterium]